MKILTWKISKNEGAREALDTLEEKLINIDERPVFVIGHYLIQSYPEKKIYAHFLVEVKKIIDEVRRQYH
jgi:hypothetical protein